MADEINLWEKPHAEEMFMIVGWRQWADAGSASSALPLYLVELCKGRQIGELRPDGFYLFQFPGTHDLIRPVVKYEDGYPVSLESPRNDIFYFENSQRGIVVFLGDEPHLDIDRYVAALLQLVRQLRIKRIIGLGGVYGELPYNKERSVSCSYSLPALKQALSNLAVTFSNYHGGASIGSYICRRASEQGIDYVSLYAFVPMYDFSNISQVNNSIRIENDYMAWLGLMRRVNYLLKTNIDLDDLIRKSDLLVKTVDSKLQELENLAPQLGIREYIDRITAEFKETPFIPLDDIWEEKLRGLLDKLEGDEGNPDNPDDR
jgi:predicted ATP-grasp superfamily ATP-dependent carboligase